MAAERFTLLLGSRRRPFDSFNAAYRAGVAAARSGAHSRFSVEDDRGQRQTFNRDGSTAGPLLRNPGAPGAAFARCVQEVSKSPAVYSPRGVCAAAGRAKYGAAKFAKMAQAGKRAKRKRRGKKNPSAYALIKPGSRVTIVDRFGKQRTGRAVMLGPAGWVLNMGGAHGTPAIADERNVVKVSGGAAAATLAHRRLVNTGTMKPYPEAYRVGMHARGSQGIHSRAAALKEFEAWYDYRSAHLDTSFPKAEFKRQYLIGWGDRTRKNGAPNPTARGHVPATRKKGKGARANSGKPGGYQVVFNHKMSFGTVPGFLKRFKTLAAAKRYADKVNASAKSKGKGTAVVLELTDNPGKARRRNPAHSEANAVATYEKFHGRAPDKNVTITTRIRTHDVLAGVGRLIELVVDSIRGHYRVTLRGFRGAMLAENPGKPPDFEGRQLFIEGGDQAVDLADFGITRPAHETETLGKVRRIVYDTRKDHLGDEGGDALYRHAFLKSHPDLIYDTRNKLLSLSGGDYTLPAEGIDG